VFLRWSIIPFRIDMHSVQVPWEQILGSFLCEFVKRPGAAMALSLEFTIGLIGITDFALNLLLIFVTAILTSVFNRTMLECSPFRSYEALS
jgi:hypothetical protein